MEPESCFLFVKYGKESLFFKLPFCENFHVVMVSNKGSLVVNQFFVVSLIGLEWQLKDVTEPLDLLASLLQAHPVLVLCVCVRLQQRCAS